jgi:HicA toxin of bacterial toxin-antitoxin,
MKLPRNLTGAQLIKALQQLGYQATRQTGSHVRLTCRPLPNPLPQAGEGANESLREFHVKEHHLTIPLHDPLRIGTLAAILADVAAHHGMTREALVIELFGK